MRCDINFREGRRHAQAWWSILWSDACCVVSSVAVGHTRLFSDFSPSLHSAPSRKDRWKWIVRGRLRTLAARKMSMMRFEEFSLITRGWLLADFCDGRRSSSQNRVKFSNTWLYAERYRWGESPACAKLAHTQGWFTREDAWSQLPPVFCSRGPWSSLGSTFLIQLTPT
jgi:hypothetical protein